MKVTPAIIRHDFIGLKAKVVRAQPRHIIGTAGTVVKETQNTFVILQGKKRKTIVKDQTVFHFTLLDDTIVEIDGKMLKGRPEERLKNRVKRLW